MPLTTELGLDDRCRRVVARMSVLAEADAPSSLAFIGEGRAPRGSGSSRAPKGATLRSTDGPPSTERSLAEHWHWRFRHARSDHHLWMLCTMAERAYITARFGPRMPESAEQMVDRVLEEYEGIAPMEVALVENTNERWVRKVRVHAGRDPDTGQMAQTNVRTDRARELRAEGLSLAAIGRELGVSAMTVSRWLKEAA